MSNISKQELISNLQEKISQFKSNFSKIKESRKISPELDFEINRDGLKHFFKNKPNTESQAQNQLSSKPQSNIHDIYNIKKTIDDNKKIPKLEQNIKSEDNIINKSENGDNNSLNIGAKIKNYNFMSNEGDNNNAMNNKIKEQNNRNNPINRDTRNNFEYDNKNKIQEKNEKNRDNNSKRNLNNMNYEELNIERINNIKKLDKQEKRDKSAPKISINQKINNFFFEKPLTDKKYDNNIKNINQTSNYNKLLINNNNNIKKSNNTEELYQKLLLNLNINSSTNKNNGKYYNFNFINNNNYNYNREDNPNKSYGHINIKDTNLFYEVNGNINKNIYNTQKRNYYRNGLNLDHLKDLYSKKTEDYKIPKKSMFKSKMDLFYQELNEYKNANYNKKKELKNYSKNNIYLNNNYAPNTQLNDFIKYTNNSKMSNNNNPKKENINNNNGLDENNIGYNEINNVKKYLNDLSKEEMNNLPNNIKTELKEIFNILYQKLND